VNKIILALDTTNLEEALDITKKIKNKIFTVKLGLEFFNAHGKAGVKKFNEIGSGSVTTLTEKLKKYWGLNSKVRNWFLSGKLGTSIS